MSDRTGALAAIKSPDSMLVLTITQGVYLLAMLAAVCAVFHRRPGVRAFGGAFLAASLPINLLGDMVNIGTLLAFVIVCAGVWIVRRRNPNLERPFRTPMVPLVPILGIVSALYLIWTLPALTKIVVVAWLVFGLLIYFTYSVKHSKVQRALQAEEKVGGPPPIART